MSSSIAEVQDKKEGKIQQKYPSRPSSKQDEAPALHQQSEADAAKTLQRTYRGYRARRQLQGLSLDPASRWTEAIKEAQYRALTSPKSRGGDTSSTPKYTTHTTHDLATPTSPTSSQAIHRRSSTAKSQWAFAGQIARRANKDEGSSRSGSSDNDTEAPTHDAQSPTQKKAKKQRKLAEKQDRVRSAKTMDLSYFLEMVDQKHRYGSNLRKYHAYWKSQEDCYENFFYWLDFGAGRSVDLGGLPGKGACSRGRLEEMRVRYLGREDRRLYEVVVGEGGKLVWRKDTKCRVDTSEEWRDSVEGIVRVEDAAPKWEGDRPGILRGSSEGSGLSSGIEGIEAGAIQTEGSKGEVAKDQKDEKMERKTSLSGIFKKDKSEKPKQPKQKWIFVADTKNNLYIGLKQSGAFQHSSFLHGSRVSVAGLIHVKDGQLRMLEPRSGHYRTPSHNLHIFIKSLQERGVDMSVAAVPGSYVAMVGIEGYMKTKGRWKGFKEGVKGIVGGGKKGGEAEKKGDGGEQEKQKAEG